MKKIFVLDTNIILHDSACIDQFEDNDVVIPIAVLEELDHFKKGNEMVNYHARQFARTLDKISDDILFDKGVSLGENRGLLKIDVTSSNDFDNRDIFTEDIPDHRILASAYKLSKLLKKERVILLSKDVNLRLKARSIGVESQDYFSDSVKNMDELYTGKTVLENISEDTIDSLYTVPFELEFSSTGIEETPKGWHHYILKNVQKSALAAYNPNSLKLVHVDKKTVASIIPRNAEQIFALNLLTNLDIPLVTISGKAGTGKTLLALAGALEKRKNYQQIFIARPIVPLSNKDIGFLPGDIKAKIDPYLQPLWDNLKVIQNQYTRSHSEFDKIDEMIKDEKIIVAPLTYIRGRSLQKIFFIVDEAQNLTPHEVKTIITRAGENTKIVFTGDIYQIDHPFLDSHSNGLTYLIDRFKGEKLFGHINLEKGERSELAELASNLL
jgi:PhoH-like ATPase